MYVFQNKTIYKLNSCLRNGWRYSARVMETYTLEFKIENKIRYTKCLYFFRLFNPNSRLYRFNTLNVCEGKCCIVVFAVSFTLLPVSL